MKFKKCGSITAGCAASSKKIQKNFEGSKLSKGVSTSSTSFKEDFVESMANVWKKISLKVWPTFQRRFHWKYGQLERERRHAFPRVPRVWKKISLKVWPTFQRRFRWKYGQLERERFESTTSWSVSTSSTSLKEDFIESTANVWKKISLKVWPTWTGSGVSTSSTCFKEDFAESMANVSKKKLKSVNVNDHQPLFESKERLRSSEIKEDGLRFVLRVSEELYLNIYWILNIIWIGI